MGLIDTPEAMRLRIAGRALDGAEVLLDLAIDEGDPVDDLLLAVEVAREEFALAVVHICDKHGLGGPQ